jgi:hypothetical protein
MGAICMGITKMLPEQEYALQLGLGFVAGTTYYIASNCIFNRETVKELLELLSKKIVNHHERK